MELDSFSITRIGTRVGARTWTIPLLHIGIQRYGCLDSKHRHMQSTWGPWHASRRRETAESV